MIDVSKHDAEHGAGDLAMDLTPLLDVLFMVLVFFLLTANSVPVALKLDLPRDGTDSAQPIGNDQLIRLEIHADAPYWRIDGQPFAEWDQARDQLQLLHTGSPDSAIVIAGERKAPLEYMVSVLGFLEAEQIPVVQVLLDPAGRSHQLPSADPVGQQPGEYLP